MMSKRPASPLMERPSSDIIRPRRTERRMVWKNLDLYHDASVAGKTFLTQHAFDEPGLMYAYEISFEYAIWKEAQTNPAKFVADLRAERPSFTDIPIAGSITTNMNELVSKADVQEWFRPKFHAKRTQHMVVRSMHKLSSQLYWAAQLGMGCLAHLEFNCFTTCGYKWQVIFSAAFRRFVIYMIPLQPQVHLSDAQWLIPVFMSMEPPYLVTRTPVFVVPSEVQSDYLPKLLPRCVFQIHPAHIVDLTTYILYAPILVQLLHAVDGFTLPIVQRIASFLWPSVDTIHQ